MVLPAVPRRRRPAQHSVGGMAGRGNTDRHLGYISVWLRASVVVVVLDHVDSVARGGGVEGKMHSGSLDVGFRYRGLGKEVLDGARKVGGCLRGVGV